MKTENGKARDEMALSIRLLQVVGSPFVQKQSNIHSDEIARLHEYSTRNRMGFFYSDTILQTGNAECLKRICEKERTRYTETLEAVSRVSSLLSNSEIEHAVFKTIRPYTSTTVDIDIIIFGTENDYKNAIGMMQKAGHRIVVYGPRSTTLKDTKIDMGIDIYEQVAVSFITYIDKTMLSRYISTETLPNCLPMRTLKPEADLACIIAHSMIKEQMYTLSEYYSYIYYLRQMNIDNFVEIVRKNNITIAARTHTAITALLHNTAHKAIPARLQQVQDNLGTENFETTRLIANDFDTPHKYHPITVVRSLLEIAKGRKARRSMAEQASHMFDPKISRDFLGKLFNHVSRETY